MSKEIKIGLIGAGWMGKAHTTAFHNARMIFGDDMPVFELVSDVSEDAVAKFAKNMGYNRYTTNWMDVVTDPAIDLVDVATPNCMHYEMAKAALEHGKHVFCEKPLSLSAEQSRELADLAKEKGVVNYCGFSNIMNPANQYVAELVKSGKLGKIMRVHATYDQDMLLDPSIPIAWRHINKLAGSGALGDLCSHLLSVSQMIMGDMSEVQVYFKADADKDNGRDCGFRTVLLNPQHKGFKYFQPAGGIAIAFDDMKTLQAHALMQAMHGGAYICDFEMGAKVDGIINAVLKSVKSGTWEKC